MPPTTVTSVERFHVNHVALICLVTLTFDFLTIGRKMTHFPLLVSALVGLVTLTFDLWPTHYINFGISGTFCSRLMGQHLSDAHVTSRPWHLTLEVMALVDNMGLRAPLDRGTQQTDRRTDGQTPCLILWWPLPPNGGWSIIKTATVTNYEH